MPTVEQPFTLEAFRNDLNEFSEAVITMFEGSDEATASAVHMESIGAAAGKAAATLQSALEDSDNLQQSEVDDIDQSSVIASDIADCFHRMAERLRS